MATRSLEEPLSCGPLNSPATEAMEVDSKPSKTSEVDTCCICMETISNTDRADLLPCNHRYHKVCIDQWFRTPGSNRRCSYCRTEATQVRYNYQPDGTFQVEGSGRRSTAAATRGQSRRMRFLMCIITSRVYLYTLATESFFTIVNSSDRLLELVNDDSELMHSVLPGAQQRLTNITLNYNMRFQDEPQVEFTLFNMDNFFNGSVLVPNRSTIVQTRQILTRELNNIETQRNERLAGEIDDIEEVETPRMRRRRERSERVQAQPRRGGRGGGRGRGNQGINQAARQ